MLPVAHLQWHCWDQCLFREVPVADLTSAGRAVAADLADRKGWEDVLQVKLASLLPLQVFVPVHAQGQMACREAYGPIESCQHVALRHADT